MPALYREDLDGFRCKCVHAVHAGAMLWHAAPGAAAAHPQNPGGGKPPMHYVSARATLDDLLTSLAARNARSRGDTREPLEVHTGNKAFHKMPCCKKRW